MSDLKQFKNLCITTVEEMEDEIYDWVIKIPATGLMTNTGLNNYVLDLLPCQFVTGMLSKDPRVKMLGRIDRASKILYIIFETPTHIQKRTMVVKSLEYNFSEKAQSVHIISHNPYVASDVNPKLVDGRMMIIISQAVSLVPFWKDGIDTIKITLGMRVDLGEIGIKSRDTTAAAVWLDDKLPPVCTNLSESDLLGQFLDSATLSDITLCCKGKEFLAHKIILSIASPVFKKMFESELSETKEGQVVIEDIEPKTLKLLLKCIYAPKGLSPDELCDVDGLIDLFVAAHKYCLDQVIDSTAIHILAKIEPSTAIQVYVLGVTYDQEEMKQRASDVIKWNKQEIFGDKKMFKEAMKYPKLVKEWMIL